MRQWHAHTPPYTHVTYKGNKGTLPRALMVTQRAQRDHDRKDQTDAQPHVRVAHTRHAHCTNQGTRKREHGARGHNKTGHAPAARGASRVLRPLQGRHALPAQRVAALQHLGHVGVGRCAVRLRANVAREGGLHFAGDSRNHGMAITARSCAFWPCGQYPGGQEQLAGKFHAAGLVSVCVNVFSPAERGVTDASMLIHTKLQ